MSDTGWDWQDLASNFTWEGFHSLLQNFASKTRIIHRFDPDNLLVTCKNTQHDNIKQCAVIIKAPWNMPLQHNDQPPQDEP